MSDKLYAAIRVNKNLAWYLLEYTHEVNGVQNAVEYIRMNNEKDFVFWRGEMYEVVETVVVDTLEPYDI